MAHTYVVDIPFVALADESRMQVEFLHPWNIVYVIDTQVHHWYFVGASVKRRSGDKRKSSLFHFDRNVI